VVAPENGRRVDHGRDPRLQLPVASLGLLEVALRLGSPPEKEPEELDPLGACERVPLGPDEGGRDRQSEFAAPRERFDVVRGVDREEGDVGRAGQEHLEVGGEVPGIPHLAELATLDARTDRVVEDRLATDGDQPIRDAQLHTEPEEVVVVDGVARRGDLDERRVRGCPLRDATPTGDDDQSVFDHLGVSPRLERGHLAGGAHDEEPVSALDAEVARVSDLGTDERRRLGSLLEGERRIDSRSIIGAPRKHEAEGEGPRDTLNEGADRASTRIEEMQWWVRERRLRTIRC